MNWAEAVTGVAMLLGGAALVWYGTPFYALLGVSVSVFSLVWALSLRLHDASIADIAWGPSLAILIAAAAFFNEQLNWADMLLIALSAVWGLRLAWHINRRHRQQGEDKRYRRWREQYGDSFWWQSWLRIFLLQGVMAWLVSAAGAAAVAADAPVGAVWLPALGGVLWLLGFVFEATADQQLWRFKQDPDNRGKVLRSGLWALSRHPNYFGEALLWWGLALIALPQVGLWFLLAPAFITFLLMKVSGVSMLEADLRDSKPDYADYVREVPAFFPRLSKGRG